MDPLRHLSDEGDVRDPTQRSISQGEDPVGLVWGPVGSRLPSPGAKRWGGGYLDDTAQTEVRVVEDPPNQVRAVESRRGTGGRGIGGRGWWKVGRGKVK